MLQQTTVKAVLPRYDLFLRRWPDVTALARAELGEVLAAWAGLGYYARARNLHACAREVAERMAGKFPSDEAGLRKLPGIGDYTAAAIAAIAFGKRATPVDGNIERVVARLFAVATPLPAAKAEIRALAETSDARDARRRLRAGDDGSWAPRSARRAARLAVSVRCGPTAAAMPRARRGAALSRGEERAPDAARRDLRRASAPTARCCCASGRCTACWAACWRRRHRLGPRDRAQRKVGARTTRRSRPNGRSCPASSSTLSRISTRSFRSIAPRSGSMPQPEARSSARALPLAQAARACRRRAAVSDAESSCCTRSTRAARRKAACGFELRPRRLAQGVDRLEAAFSLVMPEGPAVAGERALHMRADLVDRALRAGAGDRAVGADFRLVPRRRNRKAPCPARSARARPGRRTGCAARARLPLATCSESLASGASAVEPRSRRLGISSPRARCR